MKNLIDQKILEMLETKKCFIFDFDGTIASTNIIIFKSMQKVCSLYGCEFSEEDFEDVKDKPSSEYFVKMQEVVKQPLDKLTVLNQYNDACNSLLGKVKIPPFEYVKTLTEIFKDKTFVVASNNLEDFLKDRLVEMKLDKSFSKIIACGGDIVKNMVYTDTQNYIGFDQKDCVVFEDAQKYIKQAKESGITTVGIVHDYNKNELDADFYIKID